MAMDKGGSKFDSSASRSTVLNEREKGPFNHHAEFASAAVSVWVDSVSKGLRKIVASRIEIERA